MMLGEIGKTHVVEGVPELRLVTSLRNVEQKYLQIFNDVYWPQQVAYLASLIVNINLEPALHIACIL
jgi:hypothetical protein